MIIQSFLSTFFSCVLFFVFFLYYSIHVFFHNHLSNCSYIYYLFIDEYSLDGDVFSKPALDLPPLKVILFHFILSYFILFYFILFYFILNCFILFYFMHYAFQIIYYFFLIYNSIISYLFLKPNTPIKFHSYIYLNFSF